MRMEEAELCDGGRLKDIRAFIDSLYGHDLHTKRVDSLAAATLGVMTGTSLAVATIGQTLAQARGLVTKHVIKQVDRSQQQRHRRLGELRALGAASGRIAQRHRRRHGLDRWHQANPLPVSPDLTQQHQHLPEC